MGATAAGVAAAGVTVVVNALEANAAVDIATAGGTAFGAAMTALVFTASGIADAGAAAATATAADVEGVEAASVVDEEVPATVAGEAPVDPPARLMLPVTVAELCTSAATTGAGVSAEFPQPESPRARNATTAMLPWADGLA